MTITDLQHKHCDRSMSTDLQHKHCDRSMTINDRVEAEIATTIIIVARLST